MGADGSVGTRDSAITETLASVVEPVELNSVIAKVDHEYLMKFNALKRSGFRLQHVEGHYKVLPEHFKYKTGGKKTK